MALYYIRENGTIVRERSGDVVVVAPSLYWYAHAKFPTSSLAKARRLADTFLASRPASYTSIHVEKRDGGFDCYAFDEALLSKSIPGDVPPNTPRYFLQQLADQMPLRIDETLIADTINGICIEMEETAKSLPSLDSVDIGSLAKPFNRAGTNRLPLWVAVTLTAALFTAAAADLALRFQTLEALHHRAAEMNGGKTMYEIKALVQKYQKTDAVQRSLRATIKKALNTPMKSLECTPKKGCSYE